MAFRRRNCTAVERLDLREQMAARCRGVQPGVLRRCGVPVRVADSLQCRRPQLQGRAGRPRCSGVHAIAVRGFERGPRHRQLEIWRDIRRNGTHGVAH
jgi:hypothetical protein